MAGYEVHCASCGKKFYSLAGLMEHGYDVHHDEPTSAGGKIATEPLYASADSRYLRPEEKPSIQIGDPVPLSPETKEALSERIRTFASGATRDTDQGKLKYEGFFSPEVLRRRAEYMHEHRKQSDGSLRDPDNWQKGISRDVYMDSLLRHVIELWLIHRNPLVPDDKTVEDVLCAIMFNAEGFLYEQLHHRKPSEATSAIPRNHHSDSDRC